MLFLSDFPAHGKRDWTVTHSNTVSNSQTKVNSGPVTTGTIPYIRGTSETIARILQPYNIRAAHKPMTTLRRLLTNVKDKDKPEDRRGARSNANTARLLTLVKAAETLARDWPNTNERRGMVTSTITLLNTIYRRNIKLTGTLRHALRILQTYYQRLTLKSWFTDSEQTPLNRSKQLLVPSVNK